MILTFSAAFCLGQEILRKLVELHAEHAIDSVTGRNHFKFFAYMWRVDWHTTSACLMNLGAHILLPGCSSR